MLLLLLLLLLQELSWVDRRVDEMIRLWIFRLVLIRKISEESRVDGGGIRRRIGRRIVVHGILKDALGALYRKR